jgi:hypothetical protein
MISPFSPVMSPYNEGSGAGNAPWFYQISIANVTGTGLTFTDGVLTGMDLSGALTVNLFNAPFFAFGPATFTGTFSASGLDYGFDVAGTRSLSIFSDINLVMNRSGAVAPAVVPLPAAAWLLGSGIGTLVVAARRRRTPAGAA